MNAPYKTVDFILENAPRYAKAKAERIYLEEFRKTKKALLMKVAMEAGYESAAAQEREAYAHPDYQVLLKGRQDQENYSSLVLTLEADQLAPCLSIGYRYEGVNSSYGVSVKHGDE